MLINEQAETWNSVNAWLALDLELEFIKWKL